MSMTEKFFSIFAGLPWYRRIEVLRVVNGWTQEAAAERCGTSKRVFWSWENGKYRPLRRNMTKISEMFDVPVEEIFPKQTKANRKSKRLKGGEQEKSICVKIDIPDGRIAAL